MNNIYLNLIFKLDFLGNEVFNEKNLSFPLNSVVLVVGTLGLIIHTVDFT